MQTTTTLAQLRSRIRDRFDDDSYDAGVIDQAINDFQRELFNSRSFRFMEKTDNTLTLSAGNNTVSLPADCQQILSFVVRTPTNYQMNLTSKYVHYNEFVDTYIAPDLEPQGPVSFWTDFANGIVFSNPADQTVTFGLGYLKTVPTLTADADISVVPDEFSEIVVVGASTRIIRREDDYDILSDENGEVFRLLTAMLARYGRGRLVKGPFRMASAFRG